MLRCYGLNEEAEQLREARRSEKVEHREQLF